MRRVTWSRLREDKNAQHGDGNALALSGGTATPATPVTLAIGSTASATDGRILLGWQSATPTLTVSGSDFSGCFGTSGCTDAVANRPRRRAVLGQGPGAVPGLSAGRDRGLLQLARTGRTRHSRLHARRFDGARPDRRHRLGHFGRAGRELQYGSVTFGMAATTAAGTWSVSAPNVRMSQDGSFYANTGAPATISSGTTVTPAADHNAMSVTFNGSEQYLWQHQRTVDGHRPRRRRGYLRSEQFPVLHHRSLP